MWKDGGNTTYDGVFEHTYDPWNRIKITRTRANDQTVLDRDYDALGRLIVSKTHPGRGPLSGRRSMLPSIV